jgi:hypothetical protein
MTMAAGALFVPRAADGQPALEVVPSVAFATVLDDNVFLASTNEEADVISRLTSGLDARYERSLLTMNGHYRLDSERFTDHPSLTDMNARQDAAVDVRSHRFRNAILGADAAVTTTHTPGELNLLSGLAVGRAHASRIVVHPSLEREWDRNTAITFSYSYAHDRLEAGPRAYTHGAAFSLERRRSARRKFAVRYAAERFAFDQAAPIVSQVSTVGMETNGRSSSVNVGAGVRTTGGRLSPELSLLARRALRRGELSVAYVRTTTTAIGVSGAVDTQSLVGTASYDIRDVMRVQVAPALSETTISGRRVDVYRLALEVSVPCGRSLALVATSTVSGQQGWLDDQRWMVLSHRVFSIGVRAAATTRSRE